MIHCPFCGGLPDRSGTLEDLVNGAERTGSSCPCGMVAFHGGGGLWEWRIHLFRDQTAMLRLSFDREYSDLELYPTRPCWPTSLAGEARTDLDLEAAMDMVRVARVLTS